MGASASKEIRVFGSMPWLTKGHAKAHSEFADPIDRERRRIYFKPYLVYTAIAFAAVLWSLVSLTTQAAGSGNSEGELASGVMTLTAFTLGLQALIGALMLGRDYPESDTSTQFGMNALSAIRDVEKAVRRGRHRAARHARRARGRAPCIRSSSATSTSRTPGAAETVFAGLNLTLEAGKTTAIVGVNGAGKTTLMKLLARLYEPTSGGIYIDGVNIADIELTQWRRTLSVVFQDFVRYEFTAADNIAMGAAFDGPRPRRRGGGCRQDGHARNAVRRSAWPGYDPRQGVRGRHRPQRRPVAAGGDRTVALRGGQGRARARARRADSRARRARGGGVL